MSILVLQSSWWGRESWLLCLICLPGVLWWLSGSSSGCHRVVCSLWLWYFLIILTYYFGCNEQTSYRLQTRLKQPGSKNDKPPSGRPRITTPLEVSVKVTSTWRNRFMAAWKLLKHLRHAKGWEFPSIQPEIVWGALDWFWVLKFEFWYWPLCLILMKKKGVFFRMFCWKCSHL